VASAAAAAAVDTAGPAGRLLQAALLLLLPLTAAVVLLLLLLLLRQHMRYGVASLRAGRMATLPCVVIQVAPFGVVWQAAALMLQSRCCSLFCWRCNCYC
jgi:hypothetical protein